MQMLIFEKGGVVVQWLVILFPHHVFLNKSEAARFSSCSQLRQSSETVRGWGKKQASKYKRVWLSYGSF